MCQYAPFLLSSEPSCWIRPRASGDPEPSELVLASVYAIHPARRQPTINLSSSCRTVTRTQSPPCALLLTARAVSNTTTPRWSFEHSGMCCGTAALAKAAEVAAAHRRRLRVPLSPVFESRLLPTRTHAVSLSADVTQARGYMACSWRRLAAEHAAGEGRARTSKWTKHWTQRKPAPGPARSESPV